MIPRRIKRQAGRYSLVDGIPFQLPVNSKDTPALMAAFTIDAKKAARLLPGNELHPVRVTRRRGVLIVTVVDYKETDIGAYIEYSIAIACTRGRKRAPLILPLVFQKHYKMGQYVFDLPVSTEISVKGGKGIWGMPKHQASLDFRIDGASVSSQYDLDGRLAMRVTIRRPKHARIPVSTGAVNYCAFRGMLMKSSVYFRGKAGVTFRRRGAAELVIGDHPRLAPLRDLEISPKPLFTAYFPSTSGVLDDHFESWFLTAATPPTNRPEGLESVVDLGLGQEWPRPPSGAGRTGPKPAPARPATGASPAIGRSLRAEGRGRR